MTAIDKSTRLVHLIHCSKPTSAEQTAKLYMEYVAKSHGIPMNICTDRGTQFVSNF